MRMNMDNNITGEIALSAAYMGMGFATVSATNRIAMGCASEKEGWGQLETVAYLTEWAVKLERLWAALDEDLQGSSSGVWSYEVPEPFGEWFGEQMLNGGVPSPKAMDAGLLDIVAEFFTQCDGDQKEANKAALLVTLQNILGSLK